MKSVSVVNDKSFNLLFLVILRQPFYETYCSIKKWFKSWCLESEKLLLKLIYNVRKENWFSWFQISQRQTFLQIYSSQSMVVSTGPVSLCNTVAGNHIKIIQLMSPVSFRVAKTPYAKQNGGKYNFVMDKTYSLPQDLVRTLVLFF